MWQRRSEILQEHSFYQANAMHKAALISQLGQEFLSSKKNYIKWTDIWDS